MKDSSDRYLKINERLERSNALTGQWAMGRQCALSLVPPPVFPFSSSRITALYSASQFPTSISTKDQQRPQKGSQMLVGSLFFCNPRLLPIFETFDPLSSTLFPSAASSAHRKLSWFNRRAVSFQERLFFATLPPSFFASAFALQLRALARLPRLAFPPCAWV